ncbi:hypothetical protein Goshw_020515 [Gossypium schwendimanii]|uniref:Uncharacterized protein n=1 Tax=Gossypium schwendimanii TaxID=34291 RepID=A0A7J9L4D6_GOSSC|nr:hypothetical protein [Gossypium schwendimanii]
MRQLPWMRSLMFLWMRWISATQIAIAKAKPRWFHIFKEEKKIFDGSE